MDINKGKLVYIKNKSSYNSNVFLDTLVIFVEDTKEIITHGISFAGIPSSYNMYVGAKDKKANASTTNGNTYIKLYKDSTLSNQFNIKGTGATTVVSDASGNITINSTDNNTWRALQVKGTQIAGTGTSTYPINFAEGTDITLTGTAGTSTTKLNSITINHASISTTVTAAKDTATLLAYSGEITVPTAITTNNGHITAYTWTKYKLPAASHYTTHIYAGASGATANSTSDVSNPYLTVVDNTTYRNQVQFKGGGKTTIKAKNGVITISSTDTWNAFVGATSSKAGTAGYVPAPSSGQTGLYFRSDGTWATPPGTYSLPTASNTTLGGVKTGAAITDISGYTAVHIKDGVIYYKNTTYSTKALKVNGNTYNVYTSSTSLPTIYAPTAVGTAGQVLATNSNADGLEWKSVATTTKSMKVNGNNYSIYTTGTSLPTIYAPTALGTAGQVLKMNSDGTALIWATDATIANTWRPVQALKSDGTSLGTLNDSTSTVKFKEGSNITLAYSSGTITITGVGDTWTALKGATASADGTAGYAPKPTKGQQGYYLKGNATWVKPSLSEFTDDVVSGNYLPLSGGTMTGNILLGGTTTNKIGTNIIDTTSGYQEFTHQNSHGYIAIGPFNDSVAHIYTDRPTFYFNKELYVNGAKVWNAGNDGSGSGLDADLLDGVQSGAFHQEFRGAIQSADIDTYTTRDGGNYTVNFSGYSGMLVHFPCNYMGSVSALDLYVPHYDLKYYGLKARLSVDTNRYTDWREFAFTDSNVASATKLQTARTIWGQSFDGTGNVDGTLHLKATGNSYTQGIRIYQNNTSYAGILLGSKDLTAATSTDSNSWFICTDSHSNFSISKGGYLPTDDTCFGWDAEDSKWRINGAAVIDINTESSDSSSISLNSSKSCLKLFAWSDGSTYIESGNKDFSSNAQLNITGINGGQGSTLWLNFGSILCGADKHVNIHSGNIGNYVSSTSIPENLSVSNLAINNTASNATKGISLYSNCDFVTSYGILFTGTATYGGQFGDVLTGDWATYFTMDGGATTQGANVRGWIFRHKTGGNKVSIGADGNIQCTAWYRTIGSGGWYNETYDGGWYMSDRDFIRSYGSKPLHINIGSNNTWAAGGHRLAADFYGQDHVAIQLRNNVCSWSICSNGNTNLYFGYRSNSSASNTSGDYYPLYVTPNGTLYLNGKALTFVT